VRVRSRRSATTPNDIYDPIAGPHRNSPTVIAESYTLNPVHRRWLIDTGEGHRDYPATLQRAMEEEGVEALEGV
jgi:hypothetical protein